MKLNVKRMELAAALGLLFTLTVSSFCGFARDCAQVRGEVLRIHILANSDSEMDQTVKLMVRDEILRHTDELIVTDGSLDSTVTSMRQHLEEAEQIADNVNERNESDQVQSNWMRNYKRALLWGTGIIVLTISVRKIWKGAASKKKLIQKGKKSQRR